MSSSKNYIFEWYIKNKNEKMFTWARNVLKSIPFVPFTDCATWFILPETEFISEFDCDSRVRNSLFSVFNFSTMFCNTFTSARKSDIVLSDCIKRFVNTSKAAGDVVMLKVCSDFDDVSCLSGLVYDEIILLWVWIQYKAILVIKNELKNFIRHFLMNFVSRDISKIKNCFKHSVFMSVIFVKEFKRYYNFYLKFHLIESLIKRYFKGKKARNFFPINKKIFFLSSK